jgi:hypothetical protein
MDHLVLRVFTCGAAHTAPLPLRQHTVCLILSKQTHATPPICRCACRDVDGSLTGSRASTVLGAFTVPRSASNIDQGSGVIPGPCSWSPAFKGYHCKAGATTTQLSSGWLPSPMPAAGIWADPQLLVVESRWVPFAGVAVPCDILCVDVTHCVCSSNRNSIDEDVVHKGVQACFLSFKQQTSRPHVHPLCVTCSR